MKISILQFDIQWLDKLANFDYIENVMKNIGNCDLIILPEMFLTGFCMQPKIAAISEDNKFIGKLQELTSTTNISILGSLAIKEGAEFYNRSLLIDKGEIVGRYDKQFLFTPSGEGEYYSKKYPSNLIDFQGVEILPQICYDLRFPENVLASGKPDLIVYSANWPAKRIMHWDSLLKARAIENQCYVIGCNRIGKDNNDWTYNGHSAGYQYDGAQLAFSDQAEILSFTIDDDGLRNYRKKYPFIDDRK